MGEYFFMFFTTHMALSFSLRFLWVALSGIAVGATALLFITIAEGGSIWSMPETPLLSQAMTPSLRFDGLSAMLFAMISILGAAIARYARRYLDGDSRQLRFYGWLLFTLFAISIFVLSNNLAQLFLAWLMSSAGLHRLLLHFPDRPAAVLAAQKKFWISRIGDVLLFAAILWIYFLFQTLQLDELFSALQAPLTRDQESGLIGIGLLLVTGALIKSALIPFHFWLPETMEAPTPVSALMHAGIINAGGFLLIRMSPLLVKTPDALATATLAGALTAVAGAIVMSVQNDIKGKLAWSTISQMGMMILACGLGLFSVALFHIFAHSFYKAHAFMSTGELIHESKKTGFKLLPPSSNMVLVATVGTVLLLGIGLFNAPYLMIAAYLSPLFVGFVQSRPKSKEPLSMQVHFRILAILTAGIALYSAIEFVVWHSLKGDVTTTSMIQFQTSNYVAAIVAGLLFPLGYWITGQLIRTPNDFWHRIYVYAKNGGYLGYWSTALLTKRIPVRRAQA